LLPPVPLRGIFETAAGAGDEIDLALAAVLGGESHW